MRNIKKEAIAEAKQYCKDPIVLIEQRLDFSCYVPEGFGTGDCLIVADKLLHIIDFKYGQGIVSEQGVETESLSKQTVPSSLKTSFRQRRGIFSPKRC